MHVPRPAQQRQLAVEKTQQKLSTNRDYPPTVHELADLRLSIEEVLEALETAGAHYSVSLDARHIDDPAAPRRSLALSARKMRASS